MSPSLKPGSSKGRRGSLLPSHGAAKLEAGSKSNKDLEAEYHAADTKLHDIEEELDVLTHSACSIRERRTKTTRGHLKSLVEGTASLFFEDQLIDDYLALVVKGKAIDEVIETLKEECAAIRMKCSVIRSQIRPPNPKLRQTFQDKESSEDDIDMENRLADFAGVAGAFGGGITFSTTFGASRGRLDILSWAFACFLWVMIDWAVLRLLATLPQRHELDGHIAPIIRRAYPRYGGPILATMIERRSWLITLFSLGVAIPLVTGFGLLGVSVATLNTQSRIPDPGLPMATKAAGYFIVGLLSYLVISLVCVFTTYPALRHLYQIKRFVPGLNDLRNHNLASHPSVPKER